MLAFRTAPVGGRDKEKSNWIKVEQLIKASDSGLLRREDFYQYADNREYQTINMIQIGIAFVLVLQTRQGQEGQ